MVQLKYNVLSYVLEEKHISRQTMYALMETLDILIKIDRVV